MEEKKRIEAVLFTTGRFMSIEEIGKSAGIEDLDVVRQGLEWLKKEYGEKDSALTIQTHEDKYKLNIRKEYGHLANKLVSTAEMDSPTVKTLAIIAYKNPALQSDIIKIRGNKAYDHINLLKEQGLITAEKYGRTRLLKLTPQFYDYFDTAAEDVKRKFEEAKQQEKVSAEGVESRQDEQKDLDSIEERQQNI